MQWMDSVAYSVRPPSTTLEMRPVFPACTWCGMEPSKESTKKRGAEKRGPERPGLLLKRIGGAARAITAAPLAEGEAAVLRRDTAPRTILALARFNRTEPELLQTIATSRRWVGFYDIVQALC